MQDFSLSTRCMNLKVKEIRYMPESTFKKYIYLNMNFQITRRFNLRA